MINLVKTQQFIIFNYMFQPKRPALHCMQE